MRSVFSTLLMPVDQSKRFYLAVLGVVLLAAGIKIVLLIGDAFPFNADEAIVALMADHILAGDWPVFFYGQAYMGSLDATLAAGLFAIFGRAVILIRALQSLLFLAIVVTSMQLTRRATGSILASIVTGVLLAIPVVNVTLYTTVSLGGYGEALLIGNLLLLVAFHWMDEGAVTYRTGFLWGFLAGIGLWAFGLTIVYVLPTGLVGVWKIWNSMSWPDRIRRFSRIVLGVIVGMGPLIYWGVRNSPQLLIDELLGGAIRGTAPETGLHGILAHVVNLFLFGPTVVLGFRPPWSTEWLGPALSIFPLLFWSLIPATIIQKIRSSKPLSRYSLVLAGVIVCTLSGFIFTPFGNDPSGRYFLPLYPILSIGAGMLLGSFSAGQAQRRLVMVLWAGTLVFNLWGNIKPGFFSEDKITTQFDAVTRIDHGYDQALIEFLIQQGEFTGYTNYWVAYPLAFQSQERLIFIPALPYHPDLRHTERDNRYQPYNDVISDSEQWAYITTRNPSLDAWLLQGLSSLGAAWEEARVGDYHVFYGIQPPVRLDELGEFE